MQNPTPTTTTTKVGINPRSLWSGKDDSIGTSVDLVPSGGDVPGVNILELFFIITFLLVRPLPVSF